MRSVVVPAPLLVVALVGALLAGCIGSDDQAGTGEDEPMDRGSSFVEFPPPEHVEGLDLLTNVDMGNVNEITLRANHAYVSGYSGSFIVDVSDPGEPEVVAEIECSGIHVRTVQLEERLLMTLSSQSDDNCPDAASTGGIRLVDVTDPAYPEVGAQVALTFGSHTHTQYNDTGLLYNSAYNLYRQDPDDLQPQQHRQSEIIDVSDWEDPKVVGSFEFEADSVSIGCHDIWPEPERERAFCAAISETQVWDMSDPMSPQVVSRILNPLISIHHTATVTPDGDTLIIGDEWTGAIGPGCFDGGTAPIGAMWFYDISDDADPQLQGYFAPPYMGPGMPCTTHNFNVVEGHDVVVAGFFEAGVALVDFSDPTSPTLIDVQRPEGGSPWAAYYHNGHVFTGDTGRGLDVFMFAGGDDHDHEDLLGRLLPNAS